MANVLNKSFKRRWQAFVGQATLCGATQEELNHLIEATKLFEKYGRCNINKDLAKGGKKEA